MFFPVLSWSMTETEINSSKIEKTQFVISACHEDSFLRGCFHLSEKECTTEVAKSFDGCWKFLEKRSNPANLTLNEWQNKIDGCTLRDVGLQSKFQAETTANCALPKRDIL